MRNFVLLLTSFFFLSGAVHAEDITSSVVREGVKGAFKEFERQMINEYFHDYVNHQEDEDRDYSYDKKKKKKKNKSKKKRLPPGIAKKLERGGTLPPGIAKKYIPKDLAKTLPKPPDGYEHVIVGSDVLSVEIETGKIADIITSAILGE